MKKLITKIKKTLAAFLGATVRIQTLDKNIIDEIKEAGVTGTWRKRPAKEKK